MRVASRLTVIAGDFQDHPLLLPRFRIGLDYRRHADGTNVSGWFVVPRLSSCQSNMETPSNYLTVSQVVTTNDNIWLHLARAISREIRKRAKNVTRQYLLQKHVDKVKLKVRFCSLLDVVLETNDQQKECGGF
jgi:hypothetical protein